MVSRRRSFPLVPLANVSRVYLAHRGSWGAVASAATALGLALVLAGCTTSHGDGVAGTSAPSTSVSPSPTSPASTGATGQLYDMSNQPGAAFFSPSGNIVCLIAAPDESVGDRTGYVRCDISSFSYQPPKSPKNCHGNYGATLSLTDKASFACVTDAIGQTALLGDASAGSPDYTSWFDPAHNPRVTLGASASKGAGLAYGNAIKVDDITCTSSVDGVQCRNASTGAGFLLARQMYKLY